MKRREIGEPKIEAVKPYKQLTSKDLEEKKREYALCVMKGIFQSINVREISYAN